MNHPNCPVCRTVPRLRGVCTTCLSMWVEDLVPAVAELQEQVSLLRKALNTAIEAETTKATSANGERVGDES